MRELTDDILGHGPLERLLADDTITEIMVNGPHEIWIERQGKLYRTDVRFTDESHLRRIIVKMVAQAGRRVDESHPDGGRAAPRRQPAERRPAAALPARPAAHDPEVPEAPADGRTTSSRLGTLTPETVEFLDRCVKARLNILISGGTGYGQDDAAQRPVRRPSPRRTAWSRSRRPPSSSSTSEHVLRLEARNRNAEGEGEVTIRDLVRNSLRMRPDRIIVGEVRGAEALDMLQAMNTGHDGSLCTLHANTPARLRSHGSRRWC